MKTLYRVSSLSVRAAVALAAAVLAVSMAFPINAFAMETERWTAKPNNADESQVVGGMSTRITWQGKAAEDEVVKSISIKLPKGTTCDVENVEVKVLDEENTRLSLKSEITLENDTLTIDFSEPMPANYLAMVECNRVKLPAEGGSFEFEGTITTDNGDTKPISDAGAVIETAAPPADQLFAEYLGEQDWVKGWNSNQFLHLFFDPVIIVTSVPTIFWGWLVALALVAVSFPLAIPLGLMWSFMRMSNIPPVRGIGAAYINIVRGTPLFLQIYIAFFGLPLLGIKIDLFVLGVIVLVLNSSAYLAEIFRAGIQSIPKGQFEAARSLGMNGVQTMFFVIIPQTVRRVIPTMTSEFILMYKDTSLLAAVGVMDIMMYSKTITAATGNVTPYIVAAGFYLIVTIPMTKLINSMEQRMGDGRRRSRKNADSAVTGVAGQDPGDETCAARSIRMSETFVSAGKNNEASRMFEHR